MTTQPVTKPATLPVLLIEDEPAVMAYVRAALERNGYKTVGVHRQHFFTGGEWHDVWLGEVLRADWAKLTDQKR